MQKRQVKLETAIVILKPDFYQPEIPGRFHVAAVWSRQKSSFLVTLREDKRKCQLSDVVSQSTVG
jgi:hypothetical protein